MLELRPGLWHWQALHPEWSEDEDWPQQVSSYGEPTDRAALERAFAA